ncbi:alpha/beta hydrolase [Pseudalkalibacillus sp. SCS-8]|uniref:alpha/beta hydrolase n=1 Tax=Pseudalkalibacillus nanhaiensis TaxID=3115291 RepID=UPI0032DB43C8
MLSVKTNTVKGYKMRDIPYTILRNEESSKRLAILLPGAGYTVQAPLFHYSTGIFINKSSDVLHVNYQYKGLSNEEINKAIIYDVNAVLEDVLSTQNYETYYVIAKSLGTIAMRSVLERDDFLNAKAIWLTPLIQRDDVLDAMVRSENKGLCYIGDKDPCYIEERYTKVLENKNITSKLIANVDHSLQYEDDAVGSIDVLKSVMTDIEQF